MRNKYHYWTTLTAFCLERGFKCKGCCEADVACRVNPIEKNPYKIKPVKYAALQTFANVGLEGYFEALDKIGVEKNRFNENVILEDL